MEKRMCSRYAEGNPGGRRQRKGKQREKEAVSVMDIGAYRGREETGDVARKEQRQKGSFPLRH
jgi:hypothetical protein